MYHARAFWTELKESSLATKALFTSAILTMFTALILMSVAFFQESSPTLTVSFLDVGQGDAIYIQSPLGTDILIDGGMTSKVLRERAKIEPFWDRDIDLVIATHPDADHIGGLVDIFKRLEVGSLVNAQVENDTPTFYAFKQAVDEEGVKEIEPVRGTRLLIDESVVLTVLSKEPRATSDVNSASIVIRLDYGDTSFLFTGDADKAVERELLFLAEALDVDVLKVGHHGSSTSTTPEFVSAVSPATAVISVGRDNRYGHPTKEVLDTLREFDVEVLRTDEKGTITFSSDGQEIETRQFRRFYEYIF